MSNQSVTLITFRHTIVSHNLIWDIMDFIYQHLSTLVISALVPSGKYLHYYTYQSDTEPQRKYILYFFVLQNVYEFPNH